MQISHTQFWSTDVERDLGFWTGKLGWEVREDVKVEEWNFRWLVVAPPAQQQVGLVLMDIGMAPWPEEIKDRLGDLVSFGAAGTLFLQVDDCQETYDRLSAAGVEFTDPPTKQPYGIDTGFRCPSGNSVRMTQVLPFDLERQGELEPPHRRAD